MGKILKRGQSQAGSLTLGQNYTTTRSVGGWEGRFCYCRSAGELSEKGVFCTFQHIYKPVMHSENVWDQ